MTIIAQKTMNRLKTLEALADRKITMFQWVKTLSSPANIFYHMFFNGLFNGLLLFFHFDYTT